MGIGLGAGGEENRGGTGEGWVQENGEGMDMGYRQEWVQGLKNGEGRARSRSRARGRSGSRGI